VGVGKHFGQDLFGWFCELGKRGRAPVGGGADCGGGLFFINKHEENKGKC